MVESLIQNSAPHYRNDVDYFNMESIANCQIMLES